MFTLQNDIHGLNLKIDSIASTVEAQLSWMAEKMNSSTETSSIHSSEVISMLRSTETMLEDKIKTITDDLTKKVEAVGQALEGALQFMGNATDKHIDSVVQGIEPKLQDLQDCVAPIVNQRYYDQLLQSIPSISAETILSFGFTDGDDDSDSHVVVNDGAEHTAGKAKQERPKSMSVSPVTAQLSAETSNGTREHRSPTRVRYPG